METAHKGHIFRLSSVAFIYRFDGICIIQMLQSQMILTSLFFGLNVYTIFADFLEQLSENVVMEYAVSCMHVF
jgi:hypothetical protein